MPQLSRLGWTALAIIALPLLLVPALIAAAQCPMPQPYPLPPQTSALLTNVGAIVPGQPVSPTAGALDSAAGEGMAGTAATSSTVAVVLPLNALLNMQVNRPGNCETMWAALLMIFTAGILGGLVFELLNLHGNLELPHPFQMSEAQQQANNATDSANGSSPSDFIPAGYAVAAHMYDLGLVARVFIGGMSALAALLVVTPPDPYQLLATGVIAGSAGSAIFDLLRSRLITTLALNKSNTLQQEARRIQDDLRASEEHMAEAEAAQRELRAAVARLQPQALEFANGEREISPAAGLALPPPSAAEVQRLLQQIERSQAKAKRALNDAHGLSRAMQNR